MKKIRLALITKDDSLRKEMKAHLPEGYTLTGADHAATHLTFLDMDSEKAGLIRSLSLSGPVIAITRYKHTGPVMEASALGAYEILRRPLGRDRLHLILEELTDLGEEIKETIQLTNQPPSPTCAIVGTSPLVMEVCKRLARLAQVEVPVLITGETGTGKELIAESVAQLSSRFGKPFVVVNCAAVPETLLESELFGFEKGSFTGAVAAKEGMLKIADGGTLFFDEVGELPLPVQAKLLRFLQTQTFYPIGSTKEVQVDVRCISATHRDLAVMVREGKFREDLYHRLRVTSIHVPPLRDRKKDILPLVQFFLGRYRHTSQRPLKGITKKYLKRLLSHDWPGNIRELENTVRSSIATGKTEYLTAHELGELGSLPVQTLETAAGLARAVIPFVKDALNRNEKNIYEKLHSEVDKSLFDFILTHTRENRSEAARLLGINRLTLRKKAGY